MKIVSHHYPSGFLKPLIFCLHIPPTSSHFCLVRCRDTRANCRDDERKHQRLRPFCNCPHLQHLKFTNSKMKRHWTISGVNHWCTDSRACHSTSNIHHAAAWTKPYECARLSVESLCIPWSICKCSEDLVMCGCKVVTILPFGNSTSLWKTAIFDGKINYFYGHFQ